MPRAAIAVALLVLLTFACARKPFDPSATRATIYETLERQRQAWNRGDLDAYMDGYAHDPDLVFTSGGKIRRGWDETLAAYRKRYGSDHASMGQLAFEVLGIQIVGEAGAVVLGRWRLTSTPEAGQGVFSVVYEKRPEGGRDVWKIVHDHTSLDAAKP